MKSTATVCDYCGVASKWGYYRFDGGHVCDDCGDFLLHAVGSNGSPQSMVIAGCEHECPQEPHSNPALLGKMDRPLEDLLVGITPEKHDIVILDAGHQSDGITVDTAKSRKFLIFCYNVGYCLFILIHCLRVVCGVKTSSTNVKEHAPALAGAHAETGGDK